MNDRDWMERERILVTGFFPLFSNVMRIGLLTRFSIHWVQFSADHFQQPLVKEREPRNVSPGRQQND